MKRWALRIFIGVIVLLLAAVVAIEIVLQTSFPRRFLLAQLETTLQLKCTAASVRTGMFGGTTLDDVTLSLPLANESFLQVKTLRVHHTSVPALLLGRDLVIDALEFDDPQLKVHQDSDGRWNIVQVADLLRRAAGGNQSNAAVHPDLPRIPQIILSNGTLIITDRSGRSATLQPLNLQGSPRGLLVWQFHAGIGPPGTPELALDGEVVPGGQWQHRVDIGLQHGAPWLTPWLPSDAAQRFINQADVQAVWRGAVAASGVDGLLDLKKFQSANVSAKGTINASIQNGSITAEPDAMEVLGLGMVPSGVQFKSGKVTLDGSSVHAQDLIATVAAGDVRVNGQYGWRAGSADLSVGWHNLQYPAKSTQNGSVDFTMRTNWPGLIRVDARLKSSATMPAVSWDSQLSLTGAGKTFQSIEWTLDAEKLNVVYAKLNANLDHLTAKFTNTPKQLTLTKLSIPAGQLTADRPRGTLAGHGVYNWPDQNGLGGGQWSLAVNGKEWSVFPKREIAADFDLDLAGDINAEMASVNNLSARTNTGVRAQVKGGIDYKAQGKVNLQALGWYPPFIFAGYANEEALRGGEFNSRLTITGNLQPLNLRITGGLQGAALRIGQRPVGDVSMALTGDATGDDSGEYAIHLVTQHLRLFEGDWDLDGRYTSSNERAVFDAKLANMSLTAADQFVDPPPKLSGVMSGQGTIVLPRLSLKEALVDGHFQIKAVQSPRFLADLITAELHTNPQDVLINHVKAIRKAGGEIDADIDLPIASPHHPTVTFRASAWPVDFPGGSCLVDARTIQAVQVDIPSRSASGPFELVVQPRYHDVDCGTVSTRGSLDGRRIILGEINGELFGGTILGNASYDLDQLVNAKASLSWNDVDSAKIESLWPTPGLTANPDAVLGHVAGSLKIGPSTMPRPLAPLEAELKISSDKLNWRTINLTDADLKGYYDPGAKTGEERLILDDSSLHLAGGAVYIFARLSRHPLGPATQPTNQAAFAWSFDSVVDATHLDLNPLIRAGDPKAADQPGLLALHTTLLGNPHDRKRWIGDGTVTLTQSDLAGNAIFQSLYSLMSVQLGNKPPAGRGSAIVHFEGDNLDVASLSYTNRGIEVEGNGTIIDVWKGPDARLDGYMIGTAHPLRDLKLPFAADVDKVLAAVQQNATPVRIQGTLKDPKVKPTLFSDIGDAFKALLVDQAHGSANSGASGQ
jgi:hypothetical protein